MWTDVSNQRVIPQLSGMSPCRAAQHCGTKHCTPVTAGRCAALNSNSIKTGKMINHLTKGLQGWWKHRPSGTTLNTWLSYSTTQRMTRGQVSNVSSPAPWTYNRGVSLHHYTHCWNANKQRHQFSSFQQDWEGGCDDQGKSETTLFLKEICIRFSLQKDVAVFTWFSGEGKRSEK